MSVAHRLFHLLYAAAHVIMKSYFTTYGNYDLPPRSHIQRAATRIPRTQLFVTLTGIVHFSPSYTIHCPLELIFYTFIYRTIYIHTFVYVYLYMYTFTNYKHAIGMVNVVVRITVFKADELRATFTSPFPRGYQSALSCLPSAFVITRCAQL